MARDLERLRQAIREERYRVSSHANEELSADGLGIVDVEQVILTGRIVARLTQDPRGTRYKVLGDTTDGRRSFVVCRFLVAESLLIITTFLAEDE